MTHQIKEELKLFLFKRKKITTTDPFFFTKRFCRLSGLKFQDVLDEAISWQQEFQREIKDEFHFCYTIL